MANRKLIVLGLVSVLVAIVAVLIPTYIGIGLADFIGNFASMVCVISVVWRLATADCSNRASSL